MEEEAASFGAGGRADSVRGREADLEVGFERTGPSVEGAD